MMETNELHIKYQFFLAERECETFVVRINPQTLELISDPLATYPEWVELTYNQCPHCPLNVHEHPHCPLMQALYPLLNRFYEILSYETVFLRVETQERVVSHKTTAQRSVSSLMGLYNAVSGCPFMQYFRPMARFHLPLSSEMETIYRSVSTYLLAQYFRKGMGLSPDCSLQQLNTIYRNVRLVNRSIADRLRSMQRADSPINAWVVLDLFAQAVPYAIEETLEELQHLFTPFLEQDFFEGDTCPL